jgi:hypothetical protein
VLKSLFVAILLVALSPLGLSAPAVARVDIRIDLDRQTMTVAKNGQTAAVWKISSGRSGFETPSGSYSVYRMERDHYSDEYEQAPMPYALFFSPRGLAIHGTYERGLGRPRSHGCVRLSVDNARQLFDWVEANGGTASVEIDGYAPSDYRASEDAPRSRRAAARERRRRDREVVEPLVDDYSYDSLIRGR